MDGTFNQTRPLDKLKGNSVAYSFFYLKSATDRWPLLIQTRMVERLFDKKLGDYVHNVFSKFPFSVPFLRKLPKFPLLGHCSLYHITW